jgi:hypothetical protein
MSGRKHTPLHDFWHRRVEGQIRDAIHSHPEWFNVTSESQKRTLVNSLTKRIVGEIVAAVGVAAERAGVGSNCPSASGSGGGRLLPPDGGEVAANCLPSDDPESAEARFRQRFEADKADDLSDEAWGEWVNNLPQDEFWAMVKLCMADDPS